MSLLHDDIEIPVRFSGNGMVGREGAHYDRLHEANRQQLVNALADHEARRERLLADADTFTDWLSAQCMGRGVQALPRLSLSEAPEMEHRTTAQIVALALYPRSDVQAAAMDELKARYLRSFGVVEG
jgi:hypothetical protein